MKKTIIGSGIYNLDTIVVRDYPEWPRLRPFTDNVVLEEVGGTCGNVMCILAWMGWDARPLACLDDSPEGLKITEDLKRYGCDCRYVTNTPGGGTTLLRCTHKKTVDGEHIMSVRAGSPGWSRFPKRHFLRARDEAPAFLDSLEEAPAVFFFDDPSAGNRIIAKELRKRGSLIYFEPSRLASNADSEAVAVSDIIKFSDENIPDVSFADAYPDKVFIQTMGAKGVRYKLKDQPWVKVDAGISGYVVDTEGAGDWFTAALINELSELDNMYYFIDHAIYAAREQATQSLAFLGSKGYIHTSQQSERKATLEEIYKAFSEIKDRYSHAKADSLSQAHYTLDNEGNRVYELMEDFFTDNPGIVSIDDYLKGIDDYVNTRNNEQK